MWGNWSCLFLLKSQILPRRMFPLQESPDNIPHFRLWNLQSSFASVLHLSRQSRLYLSFERCAALEKVVSALWVASYLGFCPWLLLLLLVWKQHRSERDLLLSNGGWCQRNHLDDLLNMRNVSPLQSSQIIKLHNPLSILWLLTPTNSI